MKDLLLTLLILGLLALLSCSKEEYTIGYTGSLSRDITDISLGGRDGVILALEEINDSGGIHNRTLRLLVRDDQDRKEVAPVVDSELVAEGACVIIGHLSSTMTKAGLEYVNKTNTPMISPNSNSPIFLNKDDQLICMLPSGEEMIKTMLSVLIKDYNTPSLAIVYNNRNATYAVPISHTMRDIYREKGGTVTDLYSYESSRLDFDYRVIAKEVIADSPKAIALITNAMDAVLFARSFHDLNSEAVLIGADATCNEELLSGSGEAVEDFITVQAYLPIDSIPEYHSFRSAFKARFGYTPSYDAMFSYSAVKMIASALRVNSDEKKLKETILKLRTFDGIANKVELNKYGDNEQPYTVMQIKQGKLVPYTPRNSE